MIEISSAAISTWGSAIVFLNVLLTRLGVPIPAIPVLLFAGSAIAGGTLSFWAILFAAVFGAMTGDGTWFITGRLIGRRVLTTLGRIAPQVDSSVRTARGLFERYGVPLVAISKFVPGLGFITPPLMGTTAVDWKIYAGWDFVGTAAWAAFWLLGGAAAQNQLHMAVAVVRAHGWTVIDLLVAVCLVYLAYRLIRRWRLKRSKARVPLLTSEVDGEVRATSMPLVIDGRSDLARLDGAGGMPGALALDLQSPGSVDAALSQHQGVVYCICPNDSSAAQMIEQMRHNGFTQIRAMKGGVDAWQRRGYPVYPVEALEAASRLSRHERGRRWKWRVRSNDVVANDAVAIERDETQSTERSGSAVTLRGLAPRRTGQPRRSGAAG